MQGETRCHIRGRLVIEIEFDEIEDWPGATNQERLEHFKSHALSDCTLIAGSTGARILSSTLSIEALEGQGSLFEAAP